MKKWLMCLVLMVGLLICGSALADSNGREVILNSDSHSLGSIWVPDDVIVILEKEVNNNDWINGITYTQDGSQKTLKLNSFETNIHSSGPSSPSLENEDQPVVVFEMEYRTIYRKASASSRNKFVIPMPSFHLGKVKSWDSTSKTLIIDAFNLEEMGQSENELINRANWEIYRSYILDEKINYEYEGAHIPREVNSGQQNINWHVDLPAYSLDVNGYSGLKVNLKSESHTFWVHFTLDVYYTLRIDRFGIEAHTSSLELSIPLEEAGIPGSLFLETSGEGKIAFKFEKKIGFTFEIDVGICDPEPKYTPKEDQSGPELFGEATLDVFAGINLGPEIDIKIFSIGIGYKIGIHLEYTAYEGHSFYDDKKQNLWHACSDCRHLIIYPQFGPLSLDVTVAKVFSESKTLLPATTLPAVYEHYWSKTFGEDGPGTCPHVAYRLNVKVHDEKNNPLGGATVSYTQANKKYYEPVMTGKTDFTGEVTMYVPLKDDKDPNSVTMTAVIQDPDNPKKTLSGSASFTENGIPAGMEDPSPLNLDIGIKVQAVAISFRDSGSGKVTGMPATIHYHPSQGKVNIPDNIPEKSGLLFAGWNTKADGSGTQVAPGSQVGFEEDTVLYARWHLVSQNYVVEFNANGGDWASPGEVVALGKGLDISNKTATWLHHNFLGWAYREDAFEPDFPVGKKNVVTDEDEKAVIVLYAVWSFDPVIPPIRIHFDMNGGPDEQAPADQWIETGTWLTIAPQHIYWDEIHLLQGWSTDKNATEPTYYAARTYKFTENTILYAVWKKLPVCTLDFRDPAGNDTANMPESLLFVPDISPRVSVPDTIPWKSGRHFTGWNTDPGGNGQAVQPGSVITLWRSTTLYAQWEVIGTRWMVLFNANGGEKAPSPQFAESGHDMELRTDLPLWTNHKFLGWSRDDDASVPEYPVGAHNIVPYNKEETALTLYAVWGFNPVVRPAHVTFDMNGGPEEQKPSDQYVPSGAWMKISAAIPTWDAQHAFLGWSTSARAQRPEYMPGVLARFEVDTVLYAVWDTSYRITEGNGSVWTVGDSGGIRMVANGNIRYFTGLRVDGNRVDGSWYHVTSGSTIVDLLTSYLDTLEGGRHTIRFVYKDGFAEGNFIVIDSVPKTGDSASPVLWILLVAAGIAGLAAIWIIRKKKH